MFKALPIYTIRPEDESWVKATSEQRYCIGLTYTLYEIVGENFYGYMGGVKDSMLSDVNYLWFASPPEATITLAELRKAKKAINLHELFPGKIVADIAKGSKVEASFARFFGLKKTGEIKDYDIYEGTK